MPAAEDSAPDSVKKGLYQPNAVYPTWIIFGVMSTLIGIGSLITQSMLLHAQRVLECDALKALGGVMVVVSVITIVAGLAALRWKMLQEPPEGKGDEVIPPESTASRVGRYVVMGVSVIIWAIIVFLAVVAGSFYSMSRSVPSHEHTYRNLRGLTGDVQIVRDSAGIPHIDAATMHDAFFGQGFVHAQDRLYQLEFTRLAAQGRLAEHVGRAALEVDKAVRSMQLAQSAADMCRLLAGEHLAAAEAYTAGINAFLNAESVRPPEFFFMNSGGTYFIPHEPSPFTVDNVCQVAKLLQWRISTNINEEMMRWDLFAGLGMPYDDVMELFFAHDNATLQGKTILEWTDLDISEADAQAARAADAATMLAERTLYMDVMWRFRENQSLTSASEARSGRRRRRLGGDAAAAGNSATPASEVAASFDLLDGVLGFKELRGSNAWATRKGGSKPICASDPHLEANVPSVWHHAHLSYGNSTATKRHCGGVVMPGLPGVLIGRSDRVSWGITMALTDLQDLFAIVPDPTSPRDRYLYKGQSLPFTKTTERIKIAGGKEVKHEVLSTVLGPVVGQDLDMTDKHFIALNTTVLMKGDRTFEALLGFITAETAVEFYNTLSKISSPALSIAFADIDGVIGHAVTGKHPIRAVGHTGRLPGLGNGSYDITGYVPWDDMPHKLDANVNSDGFAFAANQRIAPDGMKYNLGFDYHIPFRGAHLKRRLQNATSDQLASLEFTMQLQTDTFSALFDQEYAPWIIDDRNGYRSALRNLLNPAAAQWLTRLTAWNRRADYDSVEATFFWDWAYEIGKLPRAALAHVDYHTWRPHSFSHRVAFQPSPFMLRMCAEALGGATVPSADSCLRYTAAAMNRVAERTGDGGRRWGTDANRLHIRHLLFGESILACIFNRESKKNGDATSINVAATSGSDLKAEIISTDIPSMRQLYDWSQPDRMWLALPGGNNGNPWSEDYMSLLGGYADGQFTLVRWADYTGKRQSLRRH